MVKAILKKKYILVMINLVINNIFACVCDIKNKSVVTSPVKEASGSPLTLAGLDINLYNKFPYSLKQKSKECLRLHQLLFNEIVTIKKDYGLEVECEMPSFFYYADAHQPKSTVWISKKNLVPLQYFKDNKLLDSIPSPYSCFLCNGKKKVNLDNILTLTFDHYDKVSKFHYSAGTRFNRIPKFDRKNEYCINLFNPSLNKSQRTFIPKKVALVNYGNKNRKINNFIKLLKEYASQKNGVVPYVWGGVSLLNRVNDLNYFLESKNSNNTLLESWNRKTIFPAGFDCSGLILRTAQICGMPYFYKNTYTLSKGLDRLKPNEKLSNGDLIWYQGHVLIVSDINKNEVIESVGYEYGYGKVHSIKLSKLFKDISTYQELKDAYHNKRSLIRLKKDGSFGRNINSFLLLKMDSIYK